MRQSKISIFMNEELRRMRGAFELPLLSDADYFPSASKIKASSTNDPGLTLDTETSVLVRKPGE
jgi:hypothetical protein